MNQYWFLKKGMQTFVRPLYKHFINNIMTYYKCQPSTVTERGWYFSNLLHLVLILLPDVPPVQPDPPVELNWTLLTVAPSGTHFDVRLSWKAPQTADVKTGWMRLEYEVQHREGDADAWKSVGVRIAVEKHDEFMLPISGMWLLSNWCRIRSRS